MQFLMVTSWMLTSNKNDPMDHNERTFDVFYWSMANIQLSLYRYICSNLIESNEFNW